MIWFLQVCLFLIFYFLDFIDITRAAFITYLLVTLLISYIVIRNLFEYYIFRKIKLIYKVISDSKDSLKDFKDVDAVNTTLEDINDSVVAWAEKTGQEIMNLKAMENYRKKFFGDISHELKTPIFSIQGYLHTLLDGGIYDSNINLKYVERAVSNVGRLQTIVEDLEMINKLESEAEPLEFTKFDIKSLVVDVFKDMEMQAQSKDIELKFKPGADYPYIVFADRKNIEQVFVNLISNSIKYGKEGGITKVSFYDMDERILIEVSDDGIGISEEHLKHVFDRFYRADKSRSRDVGGSGLGLSIVKHIVEAHKEKINVRSTLGVGSTFGITLRKA